eukprot:CCRYP_011992-RA/>CCRYP_011992-RA protein AED:0.02 eAED:0.02 QI:154/1/1/1/0.66/0.5/4/632/774
MNIKQQQWRPFHSYLRGLAIICGLYLCCRDDHVLGSESLDLNVQRDGEGDNIFPPLQNSSSEPLVQYGSEAAMPSSDARRQRFFLFRLFQRWKIWRTRKSKSKSKTNRKRDQVKERTAAFTLKMNEKLEEARRLLLDRMAAVSFNLINSEHDAAMNNCSTFFESDGDDDDITPQSDLSLPNRSIYVVTTAALPWRTGTAVNPLLRAAYLSRRAKSINNAGNTTTSNVSEAVLLDKSSCGANSTESEAKPMKQYVTIVIPWLELEEDRLELYGPNHNFANSHEQEAYIRDWLKNDASLPDEADPIHGLRILFYPARYHSALKSIFAMGDICAVIRNQTTDGDLANAVCILEEPEHLNWYRAPGEGWTKVFDYVVGVVHTNYIEYASTQFHGLWTAPAIQVMSSAMIRAYCHKVIKLSGVLPTYAPEKEAIENVHGVRAEFIREGLRRASLSSMNCDTIPLDEQAEDQIYYIGKILWAKGFDFMLELEEFYRECTGVYFKVDIIGGGPDLDDIKRAFHGRRNSNTTQTVKKSETDDLLLREFLAKKLQSIKSSSIEFDIPKSFYELRRKPIPANFLGPVDHATLGKKYKIFVNPSISEVLCTATFEALAMGKFAIIPVHESNKFFLKFANCLGYRNKWEFAANLRWALTHEPEPITPELANDFTWEAATDRLIRSAAITRREARLRAILGTAKLDERIAYFHHELGKGTKGDALRKFLGGGPIANQVRYEMAKQGLIEEDSESEGNTNKFKTSSFVQAIKTSFGSGNAQGWYTLPP